MEGVSLPTIRVIGSFASDDRILRAVQRASEEAWRRHGIIVLYEFENAGLVDYLAGVGLHVEESLIVRAGGKSFRLDPYSLDEDELVEALLETVLKSITISDVEVELSLGDSTPDRNLIALEGAAS